MIVLMSRDTTMLFRVDLGGQGNEYFVASHRCRFVCSNLVNGEWQNSWKMFVDIFIIIRCYLLKIVKMNI